jgi:uncharacterized phiE125 gp8 family phage protein
MSSWSLITAPAVEPITLAELKTHLGMDPGGPSVLTANWTVATKTLSQTGAFSTYTWSSGDQINITTGTGITAYGWYEIGGKTDNDAITLTTNLAAGDLSNSDIESAEAAQDTYLNTLITAARQYVDEYLWRALINQTWELRLATWSNPIKIPRPRLQSITSGYPKYYDTASVQQTLSSDVYELDTASEPGFLRLKYGQSFPTCRGHADDILIRYVAGYGAAGSDVPQAIRHAIKLWAAQLFEHREPVVVGTITAKVPMCVESLLAPYRCNDLQAEYG